MPSLGLFVVLQLLLTVFLAGLLWSVHRRARKGESRYRAVVEDQAELICRFAPSTTITFVNDAYCRYFGRAREDLLGRSFMELIPEAEHELVRAHFDSFTPERPRALNEHRVTLATGSRT